MKSRTKSCRVLQLELDLLSRLELRRRRKAARADNQEQLQLEWFHMLAWAQLVIEMSVWGNSLFTIMDKLT